MREEKRREEREREGGRSISLKRPTAEIKTNGVRDAHAPHARVRHARLFPRQPLALSQIHARNYLPIVNSILRWS